MTLLENLCKINNQQGGTIHQFLAHNKDYMAEDLFKNAYRDYVSCGITFPSKESFDKLASQYYITINWK